MDSLEIKSIYNKIAENKEGGDYEQRRWFSDEIKKAGYEMTRKAIKYHLLDKELSFENYLELGPGAGTWTKLFLEKYSQANYDLIDISGGMLKQAKENLGDYGSIRYFESDFMEFQPDRQYDLFFSSRAIEYIIDPIRSDFSNGAGKEKAIKKIADLLKSGGRGFIITKTPKYARKEILRRMVPELHKYQISPCQFGKLLEKYNFKNIEIYPATISFPLLKSPQINMLLFKIFYKFKLNFLSQFFAESYAIKFEL